MKKIFTLALLGALSLSIVAQKQLPNGDFSKWETKVTIMEDQEITTIDPVGWVTPNYITNLVTGGNWETGENVCVTEGKEGDNSFVVIESFQGPTVVPSAINLGTFTLNIEDFSVTFGDGMSMAGNTDIIKSLKGKYKFDQKGTDKANIAIFGYNKVGGVNDTIMTGCLKITKSAAEWTNFEVIAKYKNNTPAVVEYVNVIAASLDFYFNDGATIMFNFFDAYSIGTKLCLDDFALVYDNVGVNNITKNNDLKIAVANKTLRFTQTPALSNNAKVSIYNLTGSMVYNETMNFESIDLSSLKTGMYIIQLSDESKKYTQKFVL